jgi:uncharacterized protein (TIGR02466 family)
MEILKTIVDYTEIIHFKKVIDQADCASISQKLLNYKQTYTPTAFEKRLTQSGNLNCWRGEPFAQNGFDEPTKELILDQIQKSIDCFIDSLPVSVEVKNNLNHRPRKADIWANINEPNTTNNIHLHSGCFLSGVIYCQSTGTGEIEFIPANWLNRHTKTPWPFHNTYKFSPDDGDIILFPGYLFHQVTCNTSNKYRINLAFNIHLLDETD